MGGERVERKIGEIADVVGGSTPSTRDPSNFDGDVPWLTPKDLSGPHPRYVNRGSRNLSDKGLTSCSAQMLPAKTVLLSSRAPIGYVAIAANPIATNQGFRSLVLKPEYDHEFVYYWLTLNTQELERHASGSTFKELSGSALKQIRIRLPADKREQRAIARILGTLDDKIELNRRMNETLEAMAQALFKSWFVDFDQVVVNALRAGNPIPDKFAERAAHYRENPDALGLPEHILRLFPNRFVDSELGPIPEGWEVGPLSAIATLHTETILPRQEPEAVWEYYSIPAFDQGRMPKLEQGIDIKSGKYKVPSSAVLASKLNPQFPRVWIPDVVDEARAICSTEFMPFVPVKAEWRSLLYELLKSDLVQEGIRAAATGSTGSRQRVKPQTVASMPIIVAPEGVIDTFCERIASVHSLVLCNQRESRTLAALRDKLLPKLLSGEIELNTAKEVVEETA